MAKRTLSFFSVLVLLCTIMFSCLPAASADDTDVSEETAHIRFLSGRISEFSVSAEEYRQLQRRMYLSQEPLAESLSINGSAPLSIGDGLYYILLDGDENAADPVISLVGSAEDAQLVVCGGIDREMLADGGVLRFMVCSGRRYTPFEVNCRTLPQMFLYVDDEITRDDSTGRMLLYDNRAEVGQHWVESDIKIHVRGMSASLYPKKGYKLSLTADSRLLDEPRSINLLGLRDDDDWVLYAGYNDPDRIRNVFSSKLWLESCGTDNAFGIENGMEYKYIELYLNDNYYGLYALGYPIDGKQLEISKTADGQSDEQLYRIRSGDYGIADDGSIYGYTLEDGAEYPDGSKWDALRSHLEWMHMLELGHTNNIYDRVDVQNAIDMYLFINLVQGMDNINRNFYISSKAADSESVMLYTPWDLDLCWGNMWDENLPNYTRQLGNTPSVNVESTSNPVYYYLKYGDAHMTRLVCERYAELRAGAWSEDAINAILDEYEEDIFFSGAYQRDIVYWRGSSRRYGTTDLSSFRDYVMQRLECMDEYMGELSRSAVPVIPANMLKTELPA